jgi:hypothetical protein
MYDQPSDKEQLETEPILPHALPAAGTGDQKIFVLRMQNQLTHELIMVFYIRFLRMIGVPSETLKRKQVDEK